MNQEYDIEIVLNEDRPVKEQSVLKATVDVEWSDFEKNPGGKEAAHYHGEDDGVHLEDWSIVGEVQVGDSFLSPKELSMPLFYLIEREVERLSFT